MFFGKVIFVLYLLLVKGAYWFCIGGLFVLETVSVIIQVSYFKYTKNKSGNGKRVFLMSPIHHHFQKLGYHESKIVVRFWIIGILMAILSLITLKIR